MEFFINNLKTLVIGICALAVVVLVIKYYQKIKTFLLEVKQELNKVSWSTRQELVGSTFVVIVVTVIMAIFIGLIDISLSKILSLAFK